MFHKTSYTETLDLRSMNDDAKSDANLKFADKETRKKFTTHIGSQDVNATDEIADGLFMGSAALIPVNQEEFGRCKQVRKPTQNSLDYQFLLLEEKQRKIKSKMERKLKEVEDLLYRTKNQRTAEECIVQFNKNPQCVQLS